MLPFTRISTSIVTLVIAISSAITAIAQTGLKTIDNPQGGKIVYGQVQGQATEAGAMGAILHSLHTKYGDKPQVGKVFQVRGTDSVAVFFTLTKRTQANAKIAGMIIASKSPDGQVEAALLSDDAARFGATINPMLKKLFTEWHPAGNSSARSSASGSSAALHPYSLPDHSASVSLPDGWHVEPSSGMGTIMAGGPNGEVIALGYSYLASDTNNPAVQRTMNTLRNGGLRNTAYANALYYPYGGDLAKTFVDLAHMMSKRNGKPEGDFKITSETRVQTGGNLRCAHLLGQVDAHDGKGARDMNTIFCSSPPGRFGSYMSVAYHTAVPMSVAAKERPTMGAILASFSENMAVIRGQANAIAAPAIEQIHAIGRQAAQQAANAHAAEDAHNQAVEKRWDDNDKHSQAFSNYLLDQTVIQDNENHTHSTEWNQTADAMVKNNPDRYEYVPTPNFWKGVDY